MNVINIKKMMHENTELKVSPKAIEEYSSRIIDHLETNTKLIEEIAKKHKRKTILERDVIELFNFIKNQIA